MSEDLARYFKGHGTVIVVARITHGEEASSVVNAFVLSNPEDLSSAPTHGWEEITAQEFPEESRRLELAAEKARLDIQKKERSSLRKAYEEALNLGFSPSAATSITGFDPAS